MEKEKAEKAYSLLKQLERLKDEIKELSLPDCVLYFGETSSCSDKIYPSQDFNRQYKDILDKHHRMIIDELNNQVINIERQIEEL